MFANKNVARAAPIFWMIIIFALSHQPGSVSSELSSGVTNLILNIITDLSPGIIDQVEDFHTLVRKNAHFIAYFILGMLFLNAVNEKNIPKPINLIASLTGSALFAVSDEFHQLFIEGRSGEVHDVLIDSAGAAVGIFVYCVIRILKSGKESTMQKSLTKTNRS